MGLTLITMTIKSLRLKNFRNHKNAHFTFSEGANLILGPNGSGKSNILEVLYFLAVGNFIKAGVDKDVISYNEDFCRTDAVIVENEDSAMLSGSVVWINKTDKTVKSYEVNKIKRLKNKFLGNFYAVLFTPESLELVTDSPSLRREYVDFVLSQVDFKYRTYKPLYEKVIRNRNKVLEKIRNREASQTQLDYWDIKALEYGKFIQEKRDEFFNFINSNIAESAGTLGLKTLNISYLRSSISKDRLEEYKLKDIKAGLTLTGPHRDDFEFLLSKRNLKYFGSRGEHRTTSLSLKMCELKFIKNKTGIRPALLLDDIFSELDENHRKTVIELCKTQQTVITSADKNLVPEPLIKNARTFFL